MLRNNESWTPNFHSIKNRQTKSSLPHQKQAYGSSTSCCRSPFITVIFNRVQTSKRVANSPTRGRGRFQREREYTMPRGRDWKKSQKRKKSVRAAMGELKKRHNMNYSTSGDTFLTVLWVPHSKAASNGLQNYRRLPKHGPVQTSSKNVISSSGAELLLCGQRRTMFPYTLSTSCHVCVKHYASGFRVITREADFKITRNHFYNM